MHQLPPRFLQFVTSSVGDEEVQVDVTPRIRRTDREAADEPGSKDAIVVAQHLDRARDQCFLGFGGRGADSRERIAAPSRDLRGCARELIHNS